MRIIAGERRGHKFDGPKRQGTRPTSDLVRESVFNILGNRVEGRLAVDLFSGTGALGLEALSRGATRAILVEQNRENVGLIHRNLAILRYEDRVRVQAADAYRWARSFRPIDETPLVVTIDPPYRDYEERPKRVRRLLEDLLTHLPADSVIVLESGKALDGTVLPDPDLWDVRRYGGTQLAIRTVGGVPGGPSTDDQDHSTDDQDDADAPEPGTGPETVG